MRSRLQMYHNLIGSYDLIDKYKFSNNKFNPLKSFKIIFLKKYLTINFLNYTLFYEFKAQRRFGFNNIKKSYIITLRNVYVYIYIEFLFNTFFLKNKIIALNYNLNLSLNLSYKSIINNKFINFLKEKKNIFWKSFSILYLKTKSIFLPQIFLSYYFIPYSYN